MRDIAKEAYVGKPLIAKAAAFTSSSGFKKTIRMQSNDVSSTMPSKSVGITRMNRNSHWATKNVYEASNFNLALANAALKVVAILSIVSMGGSGAADAKGITSRSTCCKVGMLAKGLSCVGAARDTGGGDL